MTTTITANDEPTEIEADVDKRFSSIVVNLPVQQTGTGTPSPSNPRPFAKWTDVSLYVSDAETADEPTLTIELPTPMYGGKIDMVRGEIATTYNSKESGTDWEMTEEGQFRCQVSAYNNGDETSTNVADLYAVHYETVSNKDAYDATDDLTCGLATIDGTTYLYVNDAQYTTLESFATHIADEVFVFRAHIPMSDATEPHIVYLPEGTSYVWAEGAYYVETVSGTPPLSLPNSLGKPLKAWSVGLEPYQDLHGYNSPWPAGGGKNHIDIDSTLVDSTLSAIFSVDANGWVTINGTITDTGFARIPESIAPGTYTMSANNSQTSADVQISLRNEDFSYNSGWKAFNVSNATITFDVTEAASYGQIQVNGGTYTNFKFQLQLEEGSTATSFAPYSNICPIHGTDKLNLFVEESYDQSATPKAVITIPTLSANQWDEEWELGLYDPNTGLPVISTNSIRGKNPIEVHAGQEYYIVSPENVRLLYYNSNDGFVDSPAALKNATITIPQGVSKIRLFVATQYGDTYRHNISINYPSTVTTYNPYNATVYTGTIGSGGGESRSAEIILDGTHYINNRKYDGTANAIARWDLPTPAKSVSVNSLPPALCESMKPVVNNFIGNFNAWSGNADSAYSFTIAADGGRVGIALPLSLGITSDATLNAYLAANPIKVVYDVATQTEFAVTAPAIPTPTGTAATWATAEDGTVDSMEVQYTRIAEQ